MRSPLVRRKTHEAALTSLMDSWHKTELARNAAEANAAAWRVEYRKIRDRIVDIATHPAATPQMKATLAEFASTTP